MTVPFSLLVASSVPVELSAKLLMGALCAWMMFETLRLSKSKMSTSPGVDDDAPAVFEKGDVGECTGEGYVR